MDFEEYGNQVKEWVTGVKKSRAMDAELTLQLCKKIREHGEKTDDEKLLGFAYYYSGETYYLLNDVDNLFKNISRSMTYLENTKQNELLARAYNLLAITSMNRGNAPFAMDYYLSALSFCNKYNLNEVAVMININIGTLYNNFGEHKQAQLYFEVANQILNKVKEIPEYYVYLLSIYIGLGTSCLERELLVKAQKFELQAQKECLPYVGEIETLCFTCFQARLYNSVGKINQREECIQKIQESIHKKLVVLDIFDDFYNYCGMLLEIGKHKEMLEVLTWLEELAQATKIIYMQRRLVSVKLRYYKAQGKLESYQQEAVRFYELTEISENENRYMVSNTLNMRFRLEETNKNRHEMEKENRLLQYRSETDALTGIANRYRLNEYAEDAFQRALNNGTSLTIEILDIDYFKQYNDYYGHQEGDVCIRNIATTIKYMEERGNIFCARYGGDEFIIIYEGYSKENVLKMAEELKEQIMRLKVEHKSSKAFSIVTVSQGLCYDYPHASNKVWDFLHTADMMLYHVKEYSRNSVGIGRCGEQ